MDGFVRSLRAIFGLAMLAAGSTLAAPTAIGLARWWREASAPPAAEVAEVPAASPVMAAPPQAAAVWPIAAGPAPPAPQGTGWSTEPPASPPLARSEYRPPEPPAPLPPVAIGGGQAPDLSAAYRSTLAVPPPPLIDGQRPPPVAVGWTARFSREVQQRRELSAPPASRYVVRDGDDLTGIASRFYGTPAAATLIWQANRGLLTDPAVLPIGAELVLPQPAVAGEGRSIDPPIGHQGLPAAPASPPPAGAWLDAAT